MPGPDRFEEASAVRPYALTGGRTRGGTGAPLPIEALVRTRQARGQATPGSAESRRIMELAAAQYISIAELSAYLSLPVGVTRVLVADLAQDGLVHIAGTALLTQSQTNPAATLRVLESVLDGISAL